MKIKTYLLERNKGQIPGVPKNPRKQSKAKLEALKKSIIELPEMLSLRELLVYPLNGKYIIIGGNMRFRALEALGYNEIPCKVLPEETPPEKLKAIVLQDNNSFGEDDWTELVKGWSIEELNILSYDIPEFLSAEGDAETETENPAAKEKKHKSWGECKTHEARCDMLDRKGLMQKGASMIMYSFKRSEEGMPLSEIKTKGNVSKFAVAACTMLRGVLGLRSTSDFALITAPPRRHKDWNFAVAVCEKIAETLGVKYYPNLIECSSRNRLDSKMKLMGTISEKNVIIYDDIVTTGSTLGQIVDLFPEKNVTLIVGINNN